MNHKTSKSDADKGYSGYRSIRTELMVVFSCLTAIPFVVFGFIYFRLETVNTALTGALIAMVLVLVLGGFILFRRTVEHIEHLSSALSGTEEGDVKGIPERAETRELAIIADTFNRTLSKLEKTTRELSVKTIQNSKLYQDLLKSKNELEIALDARKRAQDHLLASARMAAFGELSVSIVNELNNPLTGILGYANLLLASGIKDEEAREYLEMIQNQAARAGRITRSLLDMVSHKPGALVLTDINGLIKKSLTLTGARISDCGVSLTLRLADDLPSVTVDPAQMEQVFLSLLNNALNALTGVYGSANVPDKARHGPKERKPTLRIETGQGKGKVHVSFRDNGPGISPEKLPRIFEPFYSTQGQVSQVGLGLWLSQRIADAYGGAIRVKSEPGKGSNFVVVLPLGIEN